MIVAFALAVVCVAAQKIIPVAVGRAGDDLKLQFSPEEVFADIGDMIQFQFYPMNHSAVQADFGAPCVPISNSTRRGFFSGFRPLPLDTDMLTTFTVNVTRPDPIFFYCSQGKHCQQGFVGVINPTASQSLTAFKQAAKLAPETLSPGESSAGTSARVPIPVPVSVSVSTKPKTSGSPLVNVKDTENDRTTTNTGAIIGGVLGGVAVLALVLVAFFVLPTARGRLALKLKSKLKWKSKWKWKSKSKSHSKLKDTIGKPELQVNGAYGAYGTYL